MSHNDCVAVGLLSVCSQGDSIRARKSGLRPSPRLGLGLRALAEMQMLSEDNPFHGATRMTKPENPPTSQSGNEPLSEAALESVAGGTGIATTQYCSTHSWYGTVGGTCPNPQPHNLSMLSSDAPTSG